MLKPILLGAALLAGCTNDVPDPVDEPVVGITGIADQTAQADVVFVGEVAAIAHQVSEPSADGTRLPFTLVTWRLDQALKGTREPTYTARFLGGPLGDKTLRVSEIPEFVVGDRDLMFVRDNGSVGCPLVGGAAGRIRIGAPPDGLSPSAPSARWLDDALRTARATSAGTALAAAPDLAAPFVFEPPRPATYEEKLVAGARERAHLASEAKRLDAEHAAYEANHRNPVLAR